MDNSSKYMALGIMCGSSMDGIDLAWCEFKYIEGQQWTWKLIHNEVLEVPDFALTLVRGTQHGVEELLGQHARLGRYVGQSLKKYPLAPPDIVGYHGPTLFHEPSAGFSFQLGDGAFIHQACGCPVVTDFRTADIAAGGQGAPLVPLGEKKLFPGFSGYLNLGGIANLTLNEPHWLAGDVGPCNQLFDAYAQRLGFPFDAGGELAAHSRMDAELLKQWKSVPYFKEDFPKSVSNQWVQANFVDPSIQPETALATGVELLVSELGNYWPTSGEVLVTGGGYRNTFLMERIASLEGAIPRVPKPEIADNKEAIIFGYLALLKWLQLPNVLHSTTGAKKDVVGGILHNHLG